MSDARSGTASVVERTRGVAAGGPIVGAHFLGRTAVFVLGEEALVFAEPDGELRRMAIHDGAILASACDGTRVVSGGDDGKVVTTDAGSSRVLATDPRQRWIDHIALGPDGAGQGAETIRGAIDGRRARVSAEGFSPGDRPLQWRVFVVSERAAGRAGAAGMERLPSRRHHQP
jgi:hypothetical protein